MWRWYWHRYFRPLRRNGKRRSLAADVVEAEHIYVDCGVRVVEYEIGDRREAFTLGDLAQVHPDGAIRRDDLRVGGVVALRAYGYGRTRQDGGGLRRAYRGDERPAREQASTEQAGSPVPDEVHRVFSGNDKGLAGLPRSAR
jgi:hypothetical protein